MDDVSPVEFRYRRSDLDALWKATFGDLDISDVARRWKSNRKGLAQEVAHMWDLQRSEGKMPVPKQEFINWVLWMVGHKEI